MLNKFTLKATISIVATLFLSSGITANSAADSLDNADLNKLAQELGAIRYIPAAKAPPQRQQQVAQQAQPRRVPQQQARRPAKADPYAARRQQIQRQNIARRKAQQKRVAQQKRLRYQRIYAKKNQQPQVRNQRRVANNRYAVNNNRHQNVWNRVYQGFRIRDYNNQPLVRRFTYEFSRSPARIQRLADRSSDYLFMVVNELNRRRMPTELALLPFVESAYRNDAYSHAGAAGMWQFIPATGRRFGLQQTRSYDARLDPYKSTMAALDYLQRLNREFRGDWLLSLAAYNAGEYRVHREVAKNKYHGRRTDYWSLDLPRETKQYVPRLLAFKQILRHPSAYRIRLRGIPNTPAISKIYVNKAVNLRKAAAHAGIPPQQLLALNSGYLHGITTPRFSNSIILPRQHAGRLNQVIHRLPPAADVHNKYARVNKKRSRRGKRRRSRYVYHKVRLGDNLYRIARKHGTTVKKIKRLNKIRGNKIWPGRRLKITKGYSRRKRRRA